MHHDLSEIVDKAKKGDLMALSQLYEAHFSSIYRYAYAKVGNKHDAEDVTSNTFLKMLDNIQNFEWQNVPFKAWLIRIAHNLAIDTFRRNAKENIGETQESANDIEQKVLDKMIFEDTISFLDKLNENHKQVLLLRFFAGLSCKEAAFFMKTSEENIRIMQYRALKTLRSQIEKP